MNDLNVLNWILEQYYSDGLRMSQVEHLLNMMDDDMTVSDEIKGFIRVLRRIIL